jgi:plasmid stabilization system protein ParE
VAQVIYAARALDDLERAVGAQHEAGTAAALSTVDAIRSAVTGLAAHPLVGGHLEGELRRLAISYGATGYVALYRFVVLRDEVRVLAIRPQRELGFMP